MSMMLKQRMEAMKEIIEADTDPMKEVLCLGTIGILCEFV